MFGVILKATNSSFQKGMTFCRSITVKKVTKLLAFMFEQPSYNHFTTNSQTEGKVYKTIDSYDKTYIYEMFF